MNARTFTRATAAAVLLAALAGCGSYHDSLLHGSRYYQAPIDTHPVLVTKIDGRSTLPTAPVRVDPGPHQVSVQTFPSALDSRGEERTVPLEVKPCTRYYLVAVKPNRLARAFDVKVDHEEPLAGCTPPAP